MDRQEKSRTLWGPFIDFNINNKDVSHSHRHVRATQRQGAAVLFTSCKSTWKCGRRWGAQ